MMRICTQKFAPSQIPGCCLWLDSTNPNWAKDNTRPSDGTSISSFKDQSGSGNDHTQVIGASQPTYNTSTIGNRPSLTCTPTRYLSGSSINFPTGTNPRTCFIVGNSSDVTQFQYPFLYGTNSLGNYWSVLINSDSLLWCDTFGWNSKFTTTTTSNNTNYIFEISVPTGASVVLDWTGRINGVDQTNTDNNSNNFNTVLDASYVSSSVTTGVGGWVGQIGEIILFNGALTTAQKSMVRTYLSFKWGINA